MDLGRYFAIIWQFIRTWAMNAFGGIGVTDVIDMLIVAFVIYKLIQFLRKSRLGLVVRSILLIVAVVWLSGLLGLHIIYFVTSRAIEIGIIALVILFQQEIRQTLERLGRNNPLAIFGSKESPAQEQSAVISRTVIACQRMAKEKTGALIVFERQVSLEDEVKTGTLIDARISTELLTNIFYDMAPLHDGAVIIRGTRLVSAGCILPLTDNTSLSRELGMRHRAGIGVSEKSDAIAVIVSEETGSIAVALDGRLRRHMAPESFENLLRSELAVEETVKQSIFQRILKGRGHEKSS